MVVVGGAALRRTDAEAIVSLAGQMAQKVPNLIQPGTWNGFNVLHTAASRVAGLDLGIVPGAGVAPPAPGKKVCVKCLLLACIFAWDLPSPRPLSSRSRC